MTLANVAFNQDHLAVALEGLSAAGALSRGFLVPYSTVARADVSERPWPGMFSSWRIGTHLPGVIALGSFTTWGGHRAFWAVERRGPSRLLTLHLTGHPDYDEVVLQVDDPEVALAKIESRRKHA